MASGKSLELAKIKRPAPEPLCTCGKPWVLHFRKDGKGMLARYEANDKHQLAGRAKNIIGGGMIVNRAQARRSKKRSRR
jgi:hypothetical protein